jgi:hypothetical protein
MVKAKASQISFGGSQVIRNQKLFNIKVNESHVITPKDPRLKKVCKALV